ncbi:MAG TPA: YciI family protein [Rhodanobacteraceae bacterium]
MLRYLVTVMRTPAFDASLIDTHHAFLASLRANNQLDLSGPFTDGKGGAYLLRADNRANAEALAFSDPLHTSGSSVVTVHEWTAS